jgi:hypothetical protein
MIQLWNCSGVCGVAWHCRLLDSSKELLREKKSLGEDGIFLVLAVSDAPGS